MELPLCHWPDHPVGLFPGVKREIYVNNFIHWGSPLSSSGLIKTNVRNTRSIYRRRKEGVKPGVKHLQI
jgi:hypothetical protein